MVAPAVQVQDLSVRFGDFQALQDVSFVAPQGSFVAIVGPNGAGKSTLLRVLLGLVQPEQGSFQLFGRPLAALPPEQVGYVPQVKGFDRSFPALALELVVSGIRRAWPFRVTAPEQKRAREALEQVGASRLERRSLGRLSGGELQRVYLARALVHQPRLLLLDEPATGVDAVGEADLYRHLEAYHKRSGATILMITHDWEAANHHATHVLLLNRRVIDFGPPQRVLCPECLSRAFGHVGHAHLNETIQPRIP
ncbi:MAG: metal ABC transporter ATP-binding protein [Deinococcota bacterium]|nr:ABC transporter ATP-binding protein [Allomeiothermus silvanus]